MSTHSLLSPSTAHRWLECPGSVALCQGVEDTPSKYADEGTIAHAWAASILDKTIAPPADVLSPEMFEAVSVYVSAARAVGEGAAYTAVEKTLDLSTVVGVAGEKGTADYLALLPGGELQVHDLKTGKGVQVYAENNPQMMEYALGAVDELSIVADITSVRMVIHQPRLAWVDEHVVSLGDLEVFRERLRGRAQEAFAYANTPLEEIPETAFQPGEKQCRFCKVKGTCIAIQKFVLATSVSDFDDLTNETPAAIRDAATRVSKTSAERLAQLLPCLDLIESWSKAVWDYAMAQAMSGVTIPGYKLVQGRRGSRAWADKDAAEDALKRSRLKKDEMYDFVLISPTTAEKRLKERPKTWTKIQPLITQAEGKPTLAPSSDKRPALELAAGVNDFDDLTQ